MAEHVFIDIFNLRQFCVRIVDLTMVAA